MLLAPASAICIMVRCDSRHDEAEGRTLRAVSLARGRSAPSPTGGGASPVVGGTGRREVDVDGDVGMAREVQRGHQT